MISNHSKNVNCCQCLASGAQERHREGQTKRDRKLEKIRDTGDEKGKQ